MLRCIFFCFFTFSIIQFILNLGWKAGNGSRIWETWRQRGRDRKRGRNRWKVKTNALGCHRNNLEEVIQDGVNELLVSFIVDGYVLVMFCWRNCRIFFPFICFALVFAGRTWVSLQSVLFRELVMKADGIRRPRIDRDEEFSKTWMFVVVATYRCYIYVTLFSVSLWSSSCICKIGVDFTWEFEHRKHVVSLSSYSLSPLNSCSFYVSFQDLFIYLFIFGLVGLHPCFISVELGQVLGLGAVLETISFLRVNCWRFVATGCLLVVRNALCRHSTLARWVSNFFHRVVAESASLCSSSGPRRQVQVTGAEDRLLLSHQESCVNW